MKESNRSRWRGMDLWATDEFLALCHGYDLYHEERPPMPSAFVVIDDVRELIRRAIHAGTLAVISAPVTVAGVAVDADCVRAADATKWASRRFPLFPFELDADGRVVDRAAGAPPALAGAEVRARIGDATRARIAEAAEPLRGKVSKAQAAKRVAKSVGLAEETVRRVDDHPNLTHFHR